MDFSEIRYEVADSVLTITLNRPDRLNAFTQTMMSELIEAFDAADADDDVRAVIVTGEGRGFCAGADLGGGGDTFDWRARGHGGGGGADNPPAGGGGGAPRAPPGGPPRTPPPPTPPARGGATTTPP